MTHYLSPGHIWTSIQQVWTSHIWRGVLIVASGWVAAFACGALVALEPDVSLLSTLRFSMGQHHIAQHQAQLSKTISDITASLPPTIAYQYDALLTQRRGRESWLLQRHRFEMPHAHPLEHLETRLIGVLHHFPHIVLARRARTQTSGRSVALTTGIGGLPTDIFVLTSRSRPKSPSQLPRASSPSPLLLDDAPPRVAIVIDDMGWDIGMAKSLLDLEAPLSFAVLPQATYQAEIVRAVHQHGRDILLHLPMEPHGYPNVNPGQPALLNHMAPVELITLLQAALHSIPTAIGVNNHMGSRLTENSSAMRTIMRELREQNLFFLDSRTSSNSQAYRVAQEMGVRAAQRHIFLDHEPKPKQIMRQLQRLISVAHTQGTAVGIGHPYPETLEVLQQALPQFEQTGIQLVPISQLVQ